MPSAVIGVDGGTTKTIALVADLNGQILGMARGTGSNASGEDVNEPMRIVVDAVRQALEASGIPPEEVALGMFTLAGADWTEDILRRQLVLERAGLARKVVVKNDTFGGLRAGTRCPYGVVIAAGSGANTAIITPSGQEWAYGYYQNYGGAFDFSREAIEAVLRAEDGRGGPTLLTELVLSQLRFSSIEEMVKALVAKKVGQASQLALCPRVFEASVAGDEVASGIIVRHGLALAEYAAAIIRRFQMVQEAFDVVLVGSVFKGPGTLLTDTITTAIHTVAPYARVVRSLFEPVIGALLLAYDALGLPISEAVYHRLASTSPDAAFFNTDQRIGHSDRG
jgi:N-acetylglucosamine kinase-like BadF-type ATPase